MFIIEYLRGGESVMPRQIKSISGNKKDEFDINDAERQKSARIKELRDTAGADLPNEHDVMLDILEQSSEPASVRSVFED